MTEDDGRSQNKVYSRVVSVSSNEFALEITYLRSVLAANSVHRFHRYRSARHGLAHPKDPLAPELGDLRGPRL